MKVRHIKEFIIPNIIVKVLIVIYKNLVSSEWKHVVHRIGY